MIPPIESVILGNSKAVRQMRAQVLKLAPARIPVLITGPTGSGKELVAEALHAHSGLKGNLVALNVCAIAESLFEATLFGHARGAFTGAIGEARGYVGEADRGTLFLDEISGLPLPLQAKLLRVVETSSYRRVGADRDSTSDFRLVSATNEPLAELVASGRMRSDLAHRLKVAEVRVPALCERLEDVPLLAEHFARRARSAASESAMIDDSAAHVLQCYEWPGNIRELRHTVEAAVALADGPRIRASEIRVLLGDSGGILPFMSRGELEKARIEAALPQAGWNIQIAARKLGVHRTTVYRRMQRLGISFGARCGTVHPVPADAPLPVPAVAERRSQSRLRVTSASASASPDIVRRVPKEL